MDTVGVGYAGHCQGIWVSGVSVIPCEFFGQSIARACSGDPRMTPEVGPG